MPLAYDESVDGDINDQTLPFVMDFGVNTVTGTVSNINGPADFDFFAASLPTASILDSIQLTLTNGGGGNGSFANRIQVLNTDNTFILTADVSAGGTFQWDIGLATNGIQKTGLNGISPGIVNDYEIRFIISSVPEPSVLMLMGFGLAGIGFAHKRKFV
jgi:hypothetical protein